MTLAALQIIWFLLVAILILGYALLAGFDLGVGNLHLLMRKPQEREDNFYLIGPFWDSNQVWLITGGGAMFAAFPMVYATAFSGFYLALMLLLLALIARSVAIEFQHQLPSPAWKKVWDLSFGIGSIVASVLFGVAIGNVLRGLPLDAGGSFTGNFLGLLNPYAIGVGLLSLTMFTMHGTAFLIARAQEEIANKARRWGQQIWLIFIVLSVIISLWSFISIPRVLANFLAYPLLFILPLLVVGANLYFPQALKKSRWQPFVATTLNIVGLLGILAASLFPYMIPAVPDLAYSLTVFNASSTERTLWTMLVIALLGVPLVLIYTAYIYRQFTKKPVQKIESEKNISA